MSRNVKPRAKPRPPHRVPDEAAIAALERRAVAAEEGANRHPNVQTSERLPTQTPASVPVELDAGLVERRGRITKDGRRGGRTLRRMTVYFPPELAARLKVHAATRGRDLSAIIAEAVETHLERSDV